MGGMISGVMGGVVGVGLLMFFVGMITSKIVGVEMMAVLQVSYLAIITIPAMNPCMNALTNISFVNGYNYFEPTK